MSNEEPTRNINKELNEAYVQIKTLRDNIERLNEEYDKLTLKNENLRTEVTTLIHTLTLYHKIIFAYQEDTGRKVHFKIGD